MDRRELLALWEGFLPAQGPHSRRGLARMVPHDEADRRGTAFQIEGRDFGGMRDRWYLPEHAGLPLLLQGRACREYLLGPEECGRQRRAHVFRLLERMVARPLTAN